MTDKIFIFIHYSRVITLPICHSYNKDKAIPVLDLGSRWRCVISFKNGHLIPVEGSSDIQWIRVRFGEAKKKSLTPAGNRTSTVQLVGGSYTD
jgi:hypothetical protein